MTAQVSDTVQIGAFEYPIKFHCDVPIEHLAVKETRCEGDSVYSSTACRRGYIADFQLTGNAIYLVRLSGGLVMRTKKPVLASWVTEEFPVRIGLGRKLITFLYEKELTFRVTNGRVSEGSIVDYGGSAPEWILEAEKRYGGELDRRGGKVEPVIYPYDIKAIERSISPLRVLIPPDVYWTKGWRKYPDRIRKKHNAELRLIEQRASQYVSVETPAGPHLIFVNCVACGVRKVFDKRQRGRISEQLGKLPAAITVADVQALLHRFKCKSCGSSAASAEVQSRSADGARFVASPNAPRLADRVFHKENCGWIGHIHKAEVVGFPTRDHAIQAGYSPCRSCKP